MPLSRSDCSVLVRDIQNLLREYDPISVETVFHGFERPEDPRRYLMTLLQILRKVYSERSGGQYAPILDSVNRYVRLEDGRPVQGLSVSLAPAEREIWGQDEVSLAALPDRSELVSELERLSGIIESEIDWQDQR